MKINAVSEFAQGMKAVGHDAPFDSVESSKSFFQTHNVVFTQFAQNNPAQPSFIYWHTALPAVSAGRDVYEVIQTYLVDRYRGTSKYQHHHPL